MRIRLLVIEALFQVRECGIEVKPVPLDVKGEKKRDALNMIPMRMREEHGGGPPSLAEIPLHELMAEHPDAASAVDDNQITRAGNHLYGGCVTPESTLYRKGKGSYKRINRFFR